jgi:hypothetical protein
MKTYQGLEIDMVGFFVWGAAMVALYFAFGWQGALGIWLMHCAHYGGS